MTDRVHACLDGEIPRAALSPAELSRLAALEAALGDATRALRAAPAPDLTALVMRGLPPVRPVKVPAWRRALDWLWEPRSLSLHFRPAYALGGMAVAALAGVVAVPQTLELEPPAQQVARTTVPAASTQLYVQFRLEAPGARRVALAGSFTDWQPSFELRETAPGVWSALVPMRPGVHDYTFVVDGERHVVDPYAPRVDDDFGGANSRLFLPVPAERAT